MTDLNTIVSLAKRRGFVFQSSEIYGGLASTYDYGPLGVELRRNIKDAWWLTFVHQRDDIVGLDAAILMAPQVWEASGHSAGFTDPLVECRNCHHRFREDQLDDPEGHLCPDCGGALTEPRMFNLMLKTFLGPIEDEASQTYLRPETAQGIFVNFNNVLTSTRRKLPFGIAQIGKAFRNEITVGNFIFRTREFEQMEIEYFVKPPEAVKPDEMSDDDWHKRWIDDCVRFLTDLGISPDRLRVRSHDSDELSHYSKATSDIEYAFPWGWGEIQGIANRTDFDLKAHSRASGEDLTYFDDETKDHITPYVIEPAIGVDRIFLTFLVDAYTEEEVATGNGKTEKRVVLKLHPALAPIKVAVLPLSRNEKLVPKAREVYDLVRPHFVCHYDDSQSIGRRYRRQDEVGTLLCVTVDFQTMEDNAVTIRDRDTMKQVRVPIPDLVAALRNRLP
jgi:glycyl-tRNA synthetase